MELSRLLTRQLQPALRMLANAIDECPLDLWTMAQGEPPIWQHALHATYYFQKWIRTPEMPFEPPAWVEIDAVDLASPANPAVERAVLRAYLAVVSSQALRLIEEVGDDRLTAMVEIHGGRFTLADQAIGQIRHLMYHVGCISTILRRHTGEPLLWIGYDHGIDQPL